MKIKTYWIRDLRTDGEWVLDADNIKEIIQRTGIPKEKLIICNIYRRNKEKSNLILSY